MTTTTTPKRDFFGNNALNELPALNEVKGSEANTVGTLALSAHPFIEKDP